MWTQPVSACRSRQDAVNSYESKRTMVSSLVRTDEHTFHEAGIRVEIVRRRPAGFRVRPYPAEIQVDTPDESLEVRNRGWVAAVGLKTFRISWCERPIDWTWKEKVSGRSERVYVRIGECYPAMTFTFTFAFIFVICHYRLPKP
jgi:hypothetical protein